jgi:hypothetical protein
MRRTAVMASTGMGGQNPPMPVVYESLRRFVAMMASDWGTAQKVLPDGTERAELLRVWNAVLDDSEVNRIVSRLLSTERTARGGRRECVGRA